MDIFENGKLDAMNISEENARDIVQNRKKSTVTDSTETKPKNIKPVEVGRMAIPIEDLPSEGKFYPVGTSISIRAAKVSEIRHFSTVQESDFLSIDDHLNSILESCCKVHIPNSTMSNKKTTYKDILEIDRMFLVLAIRDLTFTEQNSKIRMNVECKKCGNKDVIEIDRFSIPKVKFEEKIEKFYSEEERCFIFKTKDGEDTFKIRIPTLGMTEFTKTFARSKVNDQAFIDEGFLKFLLYYDEDYRNLNNNKLKTINEEMKKWSVKKLSLVTRVIDIIDRSIVMNITSTCSDCGEEGEYPIQFQDGYKSLFLVPEDDILDELA